MGGVDHGVFAGQVFVHEGSRVVHSPTKEKKLPSVSNGGSAAASAIVQASARASRVDLLVFWWSVQDALECVLSGNARANWTLKRHPRGHVGQMFEAQTTVHCSAAHGRTW